MRVASRPLNASACSQADDAFYAAHPELVSPDGTRQPLSASRPEQAALRSEWMDLYAANDGAVSTLGPSALSDRAAAAGASVQGTFGAGPIGVAKTGCGGKSPPLPRSTVSSGPPSGPAASNTPKPPACACTGITVTCEHGRKAVNGVLEVVPDSLLAAGDNVGLAIATKSSCARHPAWSVGGENPFSGTGASGRFKASNAGNSGQDSPIGFERRTPTIYRVRADACAGASDVTEVRVYPLGEQSLSLSLDIGKNEGLAKGLEKFAKRLGGKKPEADVGSSVGCGLTQHWTEEEDSSFAVCETTISVSPYTWGGEIKLPALVPPGTQAVQKYIRVGLFATLKVELRVSVDLIREYKPSLDEGTYPRLEGGISLEGTVQFAFELYLWSEDVVNVVAGGQSVFGISATIIGSDSSVDFEAQLSAKPLTLILTIEAAWGFIEINRSYPLFREWESEPWKAELLALH